MYQFDLWAEDVEASRVTIAETVDLDDPNQGFYLAQLARAGKIYIAGGGLASWNIFLRNLGGGK